LNAHAFQTAASPELTGFGEVRSLTSSDYH